MKPSRLKIMEKVFIFFVVRLVVILFGCQESVGKLKILRFCLWVSLLWFYLLSVNILTTALAWICFISNYDPVIDYLRQPLVVMLPWCWFMWWYRKQKNTFLFLCFMPFGFFFLKKKNLNSNILNEAWNSVFWDNLIW